MNNIQLNINFLQLPEIIKQLSAKEKMQVSEALWEENIDIPAAHQELVLDRINKAKQNPQQILNWDEASKTLKP